ncbi:radical SAM protein, partial [Candidatus Aerophobetes bacterium]|nr:radical SAM protein [Candidatus Aerophobetes bacterium]
MPQIYGPVPSRRLGLSLGIDLVPFKTCSFDCIYCQLGRTTRKTLERKEYIPATYILEELKKTLKEKEKVDCVTLSGSGEPTLHSRIGDIIRKIKKVTS